MVCLRGHLSPAMGDQNFSDLTFFNKISSIGSLSTEIDNGHGLDFVREEVFWTFQASIATFDVKK